MTSPHTTNTYTGPNANQVASIEKRREPRIVTPGKNAAVSLDLEVTVKDQSPSGACLRLPCRSMIALNQELKVTIDGTIRIATVRWIKKVSNSEIHVGCQFSDEA